MRKSVMNLFESVTFRTLVIHMSHQERIVSLPE